MKIVSLRPASVLPPRFTAEDGVTSGLSFGLLALTLPTVGYALAQLWHLVGSGNLEQAVRAFAP